MPNIIGTIVFGLVIGVIARFIMKSKSDLSLLATTLLGLVGVLFGNLILSAFGYPANTPGIDWIRWIVCTLCAVFVISFYLGKSGRKK